MEKTYRTQHATVLDTRLIGRIIASKLNKANSIRVAEVGAGLVILPDTNPTQDLGEKELKKALHIEDANDPNLIKYRIKSCEDDSTFFVLLTQKQVDLLNWLIDHNYIDGDSFESNPIVKYEIL